MKVVTWNVNSVRMRLPRLLAMLDRHRPDVVCLQETKCSDEAFPHLEIHAAGYEAAVHGSGGRNGVAILSRHGLSDIRTRLPGDPTPDQARMIAATVGGVRVVCVYVINGKRVGAPEYGLKLAWLDALGTWMAGPDAFAETIVAGDFNVAPDERDVHDPAAWRGHNLFSDPERQRIAAMIEAGYTDVLRLHHHQSGPFSWWDYRDGSFHRGMGLRIDLILVSAGLASRSQNVWIDRDERKATSGEGKPSDHAPVVAEFAADVTGSGS